jgi:uncharacterized protein YabN with tetrapyrrole methylase and pyrophosphatase domain
MKALRAKIRARLQKSGLSKSVIGAKLKKFTEKCKPLLNLVKKWAKDVKSGNFKSTKDMLAAVEKELKHLMAAIKDKVLNKLGKVGFDKKKIDEQLKKLQKKFSKAELKKIFNRLQNQFKIQPATAKPAY